MAEKKATKKTAAAKTGNSAVKSAGEKKKSSVQEKSAQEDMLAELAESKRQMEAQIAELKAQLEKASAPAPQIIQMSGNTERIDFLWMAPVADDNQLLIGEQGMYGKIVGKTGNFSIPKNDLSRILDSAMRKYLDNRWLIVLGGMTPEERVQYGVDYKPGEVLDKQAFLGLLDMGKKILDIYPGLCDQSKEMVAKLYYEAYADQTHYVSRDIVVQLNKISPQQGFKAIIEDMNAKEAEG